MERTAAELDSNNAPQAVLPKQAVQPKKTELTNDQKARIAQIAAENPGAEITAVNIMKIEKKMVEENPAVQPVLTPGVGQGIADVLYAMARYVGSLRYAAQAPANPTPAKVAVPPMIPDLPNEPVVADAGLADALGKLKAEDLIIQKPQPQNNPPHNPEPVLVSPILKPAIHEGRIEDVPPELLDANEAEEDEPKQNLRLADDEVDEDAERLRQEAHIERLRIEAQAAYEVLLIAPDDIAEALANGDFNAITGVYRNAPGFADHVTQLQAEADAFEAYNTLIAAPETIAEALDDGGDFNATTGIHRNAPGFAQYETRLQTEAGALEAYNTLIAAPETISEALEDGGDFNATTSVHRNAPSFTQYQTRLQEAALKHLETERIRQQEAAAAKALQEAYDKLIAKPEDIANALENNGTFDAKISVHRNTPGFADRVKELQEAALKHLEAERIKKAREEAERVRQQDAAAKALKEAYDKLIAAPEGIARALETNGAFDSITSVHRNLPGFADYTARLQVESNAFVAFQALIAEPEGIVKALGVGGDFNTETGVHRNAPGFSGYTTQLQTAEAARKQKAAEDAAAALAAQNRAIRAAAQAAGF